MNGETVLNILVPAVMNNFSSVDTVSGSAECDSGAETHPVASQELIDQYLTEGSAFYTRFERFGTISDIEGAIRTWTRVLNCLDDNHAGKPATLNNLGNALLKRFEHLGELADIDSAIEIQRRAIVFTPDGHDDKPSRLNSLGNSLQARFQRLGDLVDLNNSISILRQAVYLTPDAHPNRSSLLSSLGLSLLTRFECLGGLGDLDSGISIQRQAVDSMPDNYSDKSLLLNNLGISLLIRFGRLEERSDIDNAIDLQQQAVDLAPDGHADKPSWMNSLGQSFQIRFGSLGELVDVDNAISLQRRAVDFVPDSHAAKPSWLNSLGNSLRARFQRLGELVDIENATNLQQRAVDLTPDGHAAKPSWLTNLGSSLQIRFERLGDPAVLDNAISVQQQAIDLTPDGHANKPVLLSSLGLSLTARFGHLGELADIDSAIDVQRRAIELTPADHSNKPSLLNTLGISLARRYEHLGELDEISDSINVLRQAVDLTPDGHADKAARLSNLGMSLVKRFSCLHLLDDLESAISSFTTAASSTTGPAIDRYQAARACTVLHPSLSPHHTVIDLIPRLIWLGTTVERRYKDLESLGDAVMEAASAACVAEEYDLALEWLEQGRAIVWGQILHLRSPMDSLRAAYPKLAEELKTVAVSLEMAGTSNGETINGGASLEDSAQAHRRLAERWEGLLREVQAIPDFAGFLQPKRSSTVEHVQLVDATLENLKTAQKSLFQSLHRSGVRVRDTERKSNPGRAVKSDVLSRILKMLWNDIAKPILDHLQFGHAYAGSLPHITWCLAGPLASLPLHAAGIYHGPEQGPKLFNYIISSYTPSLTALLETLDKTPNNTPRVLAVTQAASPNLSLLPGTMIEVDEVAKQMSSHGRVLTRMDGADATVADVSEQMNHHDWVHFSCHGKQDILEPMKSAFYLHDGTLELAEIMKKPLKHAELAYLSACQTASGDATLPDEAVHLAAGIFIAGYRSVVATLWSIKDDEAPLVAQAFYNDLLSNPEGGVAQALHNAVGELRKQVGDKDFMSWVPYIHIGH